MSARVKQRLSKARLILREEGRLALFKKALVSLKQALCLYSCYNIYESALDAPPVACKVNDLVLKLVTSEKEFEQIGNDYLIGEGFNIARDKELLRLGAVLYCAFIGNELIHVTQIFVSRRAHKIYPFSFAMPFGHTVGLAAFTTPNYRRKGCHAYTRSKALQYLREKGSSRAWDVQNKDNIAVRDSVIKLGYYLWGEGCRLRSFSRFTLEWTRPKMPGASRRTRFLLRWGKNYQSAD